MRFAAILTLTVLLFLCGCGSDLSPVGSVTVTVIPARSPLALGETTVMTATLTGFKGDTFVSWYVKESFDAHKRTCALRQVDKGSASWSDCPSGYLVYEALPRLVAECVVDF